MTNLRWLLLTLLTLGTCNLNKIFIAKFELFFSTHISEKILIHNFKQAANRWGAGYLSCHDSLSLHYEFTLGTLTVPPAAEALVSLQRRYKTMVPTAGALGHPGGFWAFRWGHSSSGHCFALLLLAHRCSIWEDLIYGTERACVAAEVKRGGCRRSLTYPAPLPLLWEAWRLEAGEETDTELASNCCTHFVAIQNTDLSFSCSSHIILTKHRKTTPNYIKCKQTNNTQLTNRCKHMQHL